MLQEPSQTKGVSQWPLTASCLLIHAKASRLSCSRFTNPKQRKPELSLVLRGQNKVYIPRFQFLNCTQTQLPLLLLKVPVGVVLGCSQCPETGTFPEQTYSRCFTQPSCFLFQECSLRQTCHSRFRFILYLERLSYRVCITQTGLELTMWSKPTQMQSS